MRMITSTLAFTLLAACGIADGQQADTAETADDEHGFVSLFDGESLDGWKAAENPDAFKVEDGALVAHGERAHLFYMGQDGDASYKDFDFRCQVKTWPNANSGIYFHTKFYEDGWPNRGYEAQVNNSSDREPQKTGSLYAIKPVGEEPAEDHEWFDYRIVVRGKRIIIQINGETLVDYTEPDDVNRPDRQLTGGTFAIQAHDPGSRVAFRKLRVKPLNE